MQHVAAANALNNLEKHLGSNSCCDWWLICEYASAKEVGGGGRQGVRVCVILGVWLAGVTGQRRACASAYCRSAPAPSATRCHSTLCSM